jgi:hypothetical protein
MGAASDAELLRRVVRNPGRLVLGPTSAGGAFPHGGTSLGLTRGGRLRMDGRFEETRDPASGAIQEVARRWVEFPRLVFLLEGVAWDEDLLAAAFASTTSISSRAPAEVRANGTILPSVLQATSPILFEADDPRGKSVYFKRPLVIFQFGEAIPFMMKEKAGFPLVIVPTPHTGTSSIAAFWQIARLENLSLP